MKRTPIAILLASTLALAGCASTATEVSYVAPSSLWDSHAVHDISVDIASVDYDALIAAYVADASKIWVTATVTIDGETIENVGVKLKGNSTLFGTNDSSDPSELPWLISFDKYVDGQSYDGETELIVRANNSETSLNEAVSLELLGLAGLATEEAVASRFSVNGTDTELVLVMQSLDDDWVDEQFSDDGLLYKAEADGDYSYRGTDPESYTEIFDQEAGDDSLEPLITFLQFINESDDATFAAELGSYLDIDSFATYLAYQDLVDNFDDIDGPGNNSYLHYDTETGLMTVVNWDLNLTFGTTNQPGGGQAGGGNGGAPQGGPQGGGGPKGGNILSERFLENDEFAALYEAATAELTASLFGSGAADEVLDRWVSVLSEQAADLVDSATIAGEADAIREYF
jgi:spore coat protein CotH